MQDLKQLIRCDSENLPEHLLGVAIRIHPETEVPHSGIFIRYNRQNFIFHFTGEGQKIYLTPAVDNDWFFFKALPHFNFFIPSVYAHFRRIRQRSKPSYFFIYGGALFDVNGNYVDTEGLPTYMTCVGFCLAALKANMRNVDLLKFEDWPAGRIEGKSEDYVTNFFSKKVAPNYPDLSFETFSGQVRRITPLEYVTAGFSETIPVTKLFIDVNKQSVKDAIKKQIDNWEPKI